MSLDNFFLKKREKVASGRELLQFSISGGRYKFYSGTHTQTEVTFCIGWKSFKFNFRGSAPK
jgi:hypothetical protein